MLTDWFTSPAADLVGCLGTLVAVYVAIVLYTRLFGLRSFSKMSAADFAMTVAVGSFFATAIASPEPGLPLALVGLSGLFIGQWAFAEFRKRVGWAEAVCDNEPILLMRDGEILDDRLLTAGVTRTDLIAKLREANVLEFADVHAVVFETTGDISVLHSKNGKRELSGELLTGVS